MAKQIAGFDWLAGERKGRRGLGLECCFGDSYCSTVGQKAVAASVEVVGLQDGLTRTVHVVEF